MIYLCAFLFAMAVLFWRLSFNTPGVVVAACRWGFALVLFLLAVVAGLAVLVTLVSG
jgi:hypothetical protein